MVSSGESKGFVNELELERIRRVNNQIMVLKDWIFLCLW